MRLARSVVGSATLLAAPLVLASLLVPGIAPAQAQAQAQAQATNAARGAGASAPRLSVTPHIDLADGQIVKVRGSGFPPSATIGMAECKVGGPANVSDCDISTSELLSSTSSGSFFISYQVARHITVNGTTIDCAKPDSCSLGAATYPDIAKAHAGVVLAFNPKLKPDLPTVALSPDKALAPNQLVTVSGTGYRPGMYVDLAECAARSSGGFGACQFAVNSTSVETTSAGTFSTSYRVSSHILSYIFGGGGVVNCEKRPGCVIVAADGARSGLVPSVELAFDPAKAPLVPSLSLSASRGLADGQIITVTGGGFAPNSPVAVAECVAGGYPASCRIVDAEGSYSDASGAVSVQIAVSERQGAGKQATDCATVRCVIWLTGTDDPWYAKGSAITFNSALPPVVPSLSVTPDSGLASGQVVSLSGTGFPAGAELQVQECPDGSLSCAPSSIVTADASGAFSEGVAVTSVLYPGVACGSGGHGCRILVNNVSDQADLVSHRISFAAAP